MERRKFIKTSCSLCMLMSAGLIINSLSSCAPLPINEVAMVDNKIKVPVSLFSKSALQIIRPRNFQYAIAIRKETNETYTALLLRCTHANNALISTGNGYICNAHGSTFDNDGAVTKGPAAFALQKYDAEVVGSNIVIKID